MRFLSVTVLCLVSLPAMGNPLDAFGFSARSAALGGAVSARPTDTSANYYNPAGLAHQEHIRIDLGYTLVQPILTMNDQDQEVDASRGLQAGILLPMQWADRGIGFSIGIHLPDERISRIRALPQRQPRWVLWDNRPQRLVISSSAGIELVEGLAIGGGLTYLANTSGTLGMGGQVDLFEADQTFLTSGVDVNLAAVRYANAGVSWRIDPNWSLGATWRQDFSLRLDLTVDVQADIVTGGGNVVVPNGRLLLRSTNDNLYSPQQFYLAAAYTAGNWHVAAELGWVQWSAFPTPTATVALDLDLDPLELELPIPDAPVPPNFHDILIPRFGVEWTAWKAPRGEILIRAGYFFEPSPAPSQPGGTNYVDSAKHGLSFGIGVKVNDGSGVLPEPLEIDLTGQSVMMADRIYEKDDPSDVVGDFVAGGHTLGGFLTVGLVF